MNTSSKSLRKSTLSSSRARGVTLVEVLVTLVVVSVGLLGVAALQAVTLRNNYESTVRSQVAALTDDIVDRMRANRDVALTGAYDIGVATAAPSSPSTRADNDLAEWKAAVARTLPNGQAGISRNVAGTIFTITVQWGERDVNLLNPSFTTNTEI